jgi:hypothetical protein
MRRPVLWMCGAILAAAMTLPVEHFGGGDQAQAYVRPVAAYGYDYPPPVTYGGVSPAAIVDRVGEILAAIDSPQDRSKLAKQWLEFSKRIIAKDLEFREQWLALQKQQLSRQQEIEQLRLQITQLQVKVEQLRTQNLQLQQQNRSTARAGTPPAGSQGPSGAGSGPTAP